ncbi:hypothetical protein JG688_00016663 [Phytophthora aleatoria]|uniref:Uncharacterized protein n=1 Tax=Phytophthora aleatoria TaxID=2496075 RepID=A0A8J5IBY3_9STRA|nr:hypothetical protein JG688_00016663 [Phytophthora aleatoria]
MGKLMYTVATSNQTPMHNQLPFKDSLGIGRFSQPFRQIGRRADQDQVWHKPPRVWQQFFLARMA